MGTTRASSFQTAPATTFWIEGDLISQSVAGNYSVVRCYMAAKNGPGGSTGSFFGQGGEQVGAIIGVTDFATRTASSNFLPSGVPDGGTRWRLGPYDVKVYHAADGTRDPITFRMRVTYGPVNDAVNSSPMSLPTIPRASTATFSNDQITLNPTASVTINTNRASTSFTHDITWEFGSKTGTVATGVGASTTWSINSTVAGQMLGEMTDTDNMRGQITVVTKSGGSTVGTTIRYFRIWAGDAIKPTVTGITVTDSNPTTAAIGGLVQGQSLLKAVVAASGIYGSTVTASAFSIDGLTAPSGQTVTPPTAGTRTVAASVTDSRGKVGTGTGTITVLPYSDPNIIGFQVDRATSAGVLSDTGTYLKMTLNAAISSLVVGTEKNAMTIRVFTRPRGTQTWTARNVITTALAYNTSVLISGGGIYATNTAYEVQVQVGDKILSAYDFWSVSTAGAIIDANATQQSFGKMIEPAGPASQIAGPGRLYGTWDVDGRRVLDAGDIGGAIPTAWVRGTFTHAPNITAGEFIDLSVTFPAGKFTVAPSVMATSTSARLSVTVQGAITTSGCTLRLFNGTTGTAAGSHIVTWDAVQKTAGSATG